MDGAKESLVVEAAILELRRLKIDVMEEAREWVLLCAGRVGVGSAVGVVGDAGSGGGRDHLERVRRGV